MSLNKSASRRFALLVLSFALLGPSLPAATAAPQQQATVIHTNTRIPIDFIATACNGETVTITGESHVVVQQTTSAGGNVHVKLHINFQLQGTTPGGTLYTVNETVNGTENSHVNGSSVFSSISHLNLIAQGGEPNLKVRTEIHTTINSNGEVTSSRFDFTTECQG